MNRWDKIIEKVKDSGEGSIEKLSCPNCGGSLTLSYGKLSPGQKKGIRKDSFLSVKCLHCLDGITCDGEIREPEWSKKYNGRYETKP